MSDSFDIKVSREEFQELREEVTEMRTAVLGIDGKNGLMGSMQEIKGDVKDLTRTVNDIVSSLNTFKDSQLNNHKLFATKAEVNNLEHTIIMKLNEFDRKRDEARKADKAQEEERRHQEELMKYKQQEFGLKKKDILIAKIAIGVSIIGVSLTAIISLINFFF